ncbi:MAG TPA: TldD/PmbA family protein [Gemmatimonadaceae bacterium]|jgi:TldD protein|nr:TldD/PmbA family protein [Gemmatimonadaceae bacterium]
MTQTRRAFLHTTSRAAAAVAIHQRVPGFVSRYLDPRSGDPDAALPALAAKALDAARAAGAAYADIRFSLAQRQGVHIRGAGIVAAPFSMVEAAVGVRVLVDGVWGFVAGVVWSDDEVVRLARSAVAQAKAVDWGLGTRVDLTPAPVVNGRWTTPIQRDPLEVSTEEIIAHVTDAHQVAITTAGSALQDVSTSIGAQRADKTFASTEGSFTQQRQYMMFWGGGGSVVSVHSADRTSAAAASALDIWPMSGGYELLGAAKLKEQMPAMVDQAKRGLNAKPGDVGRFDVVLDARSTASLLAMTVGRPTQLDRVLGTEANATGTSFLAPPEAILGTFHLGTPALTITGDRTTPRGAATVGWDDEGVAPEAFTLVDHGVVTDYQTGREQPAELARYYRSHQRPTRSHGCGTADSARHVVMNHTPNLTMHPGSGGTLESLLHGIVDGYAFLGASVTVDQQSLNGQSLGAEATYRIRNGKLAEPASHMSLLFRTPELWHAVQGVGSAAGAVGVGSFDFKGQPNQGNIFTVTAVPTRLTNMRVANLGRKL